MIFKRCIQECVEFGYHEGCQELGITHLCFADDLFVFTRGDVHSVDILKRALDRFGSCSGLRPNLTKSEIFFGNVPEDTKAAILAHLPFTAGTFPIRYLGVPLAASKLKVSDFAPLVLRVKQRIHNWKHKFLSFGGRRQLIISVLQSLQLFWMTVFMIPAGIIHELEALFRDFFWAQGHSSRGKCRISWDDVCKPRECGGLGFKRLATWNRVLLTKHLWDILIRRQSMWVRWIHRMYIWHRPVWTIPIRHTWSWIFRKIMDLRQHIRGFVRVSVGDGRNTNAWEDSWLHDGPLSAHLPYRYLCGNGLDHSASVHDMIDVIGNAWPTEWVIRYPNLSNVVVPTLGTAKDLVEWRDSQGVSLPFSASNVWSSLNGPYL